MREIRTEGHQSPTTDSLWQEVGETSVSLASSLNSSTVSVMSDTAAEDTDLLPIRGTKASIARLITQLLAKFSKIL